MKPKIFRLYRDFSDFFLQRLIKSKNNEKDMDEQQLLKISLVCSILGVGILFFFTQSFNPQTWASTDEQGIEGLVKMTGDIISVNAHDKVTFVTIKTMQDVPLILFGASKNNLTKGMHIEVLGKRDEQQGKQGLIVAELKIRKKD